MRVAVFIVFLGAICGALSQDDPLCAGCVFVNSAAYNNHEDCSKFVQCHYDANGNLLGEVMRCPFATYWDMNSLTCRSADNTECKIDFCADKPESYEYTSETNCRGYWRCSESAKSVPTCCADNHVYDDDLGCVEDVDNVCNDTCFSVYEPPQTQFVCNSVHVIGQPAKYQQNIAGWGWIVQNCPLGTLFVESSCACVQLTPLKPKEYECHPEIDLTFEKDHTDQSKFHYAVKNQNVEVRDGVAVFNGVNSRLIIPRFTNLGGISTIVIQVNYSSTHEKFSGMARALVANSDCGTVPSIMLSEDNSNTYYGVGTNLKKFVYTYIPQLHVGSSIASRDKSVEFKFHNRQLSGSNGVYTNTVEALGNLRNVKCALHIGYAEQLLPFEGEIDDLKIYLCDPKKT